LQTAHALSSITTETGHALSLQQLGKTINNYFTLMTKEKTISDLISRMTIEQKVGQCFVLGFVGTILTPVTLQRIRKYHPAGIRTFVNLRAKTAAHDPYATGGKFADRVARAPRGNIKDYLTDVPVAHISNTDYAAMLNSMKQAALENGLGIPLHITLDAEGGFSADYCLNNTNLFPQPMGVTRTGDKTLAYEVAWAISRQMTALGFNWIHSPVLDVNTEAMNSEISIRSYSPDPDEAAEFALEALKGFQKGGLITTGKHFPARGPSIADAHHGLPVIDILEEELRKHLIPYQRLIDAGLPCIMTAHTAYPAFDDKDRAATLSKKIITGLLKEEMGFKGAVTTDDITMGGIVERYEVADAVIESINAGCDLILMRDDSALVDEVIPRVIEAARSGRISEERIHDALTRSLSVKFDYGLFENGNLVDTAKAGDGINDPEVKRITLKAAEKTTFVLRAEAGVLPIADMDKALLIEQVTPLQLLVNNFHYHPGLLWKYLYQQYPSLGSVEATMAYDEADEKRIISHITLDNPQTIIITNYHWRRGANGNEFVQKLHKLYPEKTIIVVTNNHYPLTTCDEYKNVIIQYSVDKEAYKLVAKILTGDK
jgi:beta-N-acetylhexosaminidase